MQLKPLGAALGALAIAAAASSADAAVTFVGYQTALNADEGLVTSFEGGPGLGGVTFGLPGYSLSGTGLLWTGSTASVSAAPAFSASTWDPTQYLSVRKGQSVTLDTPLLSAISFYVGSLDTWNSFKFTLANGATETVTGAILGALPGMDANGSQTAFTTNGRLTFNFDSEITGVTFASSGDSLEISDIGAALAVVPEPASWAMMIVGFAGVGALMRRRREMVLA